MTKTKEQRIRNHVEALLMVTDERRARATKANVRRSVIRVRIVKIAKELKMYRGTLTTGVGRKVSKKFW